MSAVRRLLWPKSLAGKAGVVLLGFVGVFAVAYLAAAHFTTARLAAAVAECERQGLSFDLEKLLGPPLAPEKNAAVALDQAGVTADQAIAAAMQKHNLGPEVGLDQPAFWTELGKLLDDPKYEALLVDVDRQAAYRTRDAFPRPVNINNVLGSIQSRRQIARAEKAIAMYLLQAGRREEAVRRTLRMLRITRQWEDKEPFQIRALVNLAVRGVAMDDLNTLLRTGGPLPKELHAEIDAELAKQDAVRDALPWVLQTEVIYILDALDDQPIKRYPFGHLVTNAGQTLLLRTALHLKSTCAMSYSDAEAAMQVTGGELVSTRGGWLGPPITVGADSLWSSFHMTRRAFERIVARARCLRIINAWAAHGDFNLPLDALGLPPENRADPFTEQPLKVKSTPKGPIVYSVGEDLNDDGGDIDKSRDIGYGPPTDPSAPK